MSLRFATSLSTKELPSLPTGYPYPCRELQAWKGVSFWLEPTDPRLWEIHHGHPAPTPPLENLEGMIHYWKENPEWMDFLDTESPVYRDKQIEKALYMDFWGEHIHPAQKVLDIGGGVGRMAQIFLEQDCTVHIIDPDLRSLWRNISHIGDRGYIDVHWATVETMPDLGKFDVVVACEVFNYIENPVLAIEKIHQSLAPNGIVLCSVEARWGWAMSRDVPEGCLDAFLETGIVHVPHDRWVRTYTEEQLRELFINHGFAIISLQPSHYSFSGPFEWIVGENNDIDTVLQIERKLRNHPIAQNLNRAWMITARTITHSPHRK